MTVRDEVNNANPLEVTNGQLPDTDCTIALPTTTEEIVQPVLEQTRVKRFAANNKSGTGGLDSLGGGRLP